MTSVLMILREVTPSDLVADEASLAVIDGVKYHIEYRGHDLPLSGDELRAAVSAVKDAWDDFQ